MGEDLHRGLGSGPLCEACMPNMRSHVQRLWSALFRLGFCQDF